jgi:hypothetical protein
MGFNRASSRDWQSLAEWCGPDLWHAWRGHSLAMFAAIRRASSLMSGLVADGQALAYRDLIVNGEK